MLLFTLLLVIAFSLVHLFISKRPRTRERVLAVVLQYVFLFLVGAGGLMAFAGHAFNGAAIAEKIGWPAGNPFQLEVANANLAFGILGILALRFRGGFRLATAVGFAVFLIGDGVVHVRELVAGNTAPLNSGAAILMLDLLVPLAIIALVLMHNRLTSKRLA